MIELFKNSHDALTFAFNFSTEQYALSPMAKMMKTGALGSGRGLVSLDGAGQAGLIMGALAKIDPLKVHCIVARYSPKYSDCPCCGGMKPVQQWRESIRALRDWSMSSFSGLSHATVREAIVMNFYSRGISMDDAAKRANMPIKTVYNQRAKIHESLKKMDNLAQMEIADILESSGMAGEQAEIIVRDLLKTA